MAIKKTLAALATTALLSGGAQAAVFHFTGNIAYHNDVITTTFTLNQDATNVRMWTDSFLSATNFDPITALWNASTGALIAQNDDNPGIAPGQTWYDSGFIVDALAAGTYQFTVATYANFAAGTNISEGFSYDDATPQALSDWCQPASHCNMGTYWSVWLDGVDDATNPDDPDDPTGELPLPGGLALMAAGLLAARLVRKQAR